MRRFFCGHLLTNALDGVLILSPRFTWIRYSGFYLRSTREYNSTYRIRATRIYAGSFVL